VVVERTLDARHVRVVPGRFVAREVHRVHCADARRQVVDGDQVADRPLERDCDVQSGARRC